jgi:hypothetical protein
MKRLRRHRQLVRSVSGMQAIAVAAWVTGYGMGIAKALRTP